ERIVPPQLSKTRGYYPNIYALILLPNLRYILVESDKHAAGRAVWDECEHTAGKPIPGLFYRVYLSPQVVLSLNDRANHLKLHESQLIITGDKGYCMARATHGVHTGTWYYEATITDQPEGSATRIGWSQMLGELTLSEQRELWFA
ncbi:Set1/Ash2 histone methyltransferase complex subunit ASH2, partial [Fasciola gigantica]